MKLKLLLTCLLLTLASGFFVSSPILAASPYNPVTDPALTSNGSGSGDFINNYLTPFIKFLSASVGIIVVISIIIGAIQYSSAGGEAQKVAAARNRIKNAILALIVFLFLYAILQWVMPSGIGG